MNAHVEQLEFQAEARQLLDLMVHSVYSNKDAFLRELISNASDALDKLRIEALRNKDLEVDTSDLHIEIDADKAARTLTVRDNGIGMAREEVVDLIGTLAKSGTAELRAQLREAKNAAASEELIGQFGIGFYSSFMVADKVQLLTRKAGESAATRWESSGEGTYTIESVEDAPRARRSPCTSSRKTPRTTCTTTPRNGRSVTWSRNTPTSSPGPSGWTSSAAPQPPRKKGEGGEETVTIETETLNSMKALWARPKEEVSEQEYKEFYKHVAHAWDDPLEIIAMKAEGTFSTRPCCSSRLMPRSICSTGTPTSVSALRQAGVHHGRLRPAHARVLAFCQGCGRRAGHVAQRFSRNPAAGPADQGHPPAADQEGAVHDQGRAVQPAGGLPHVLDTVRQGPQRGTAVRHR